MRKSTGFSKKKDSAATWNSFRIRTGYDGTYMTLRNIYDRIGNEELKMVISSTGSTQVLMLSG